MMRVSRLTFLFGLLFPAVESLAQEPLCNPCVDPPVRERPEFITPGAANVVTAEDMRALGVVSVADLVNQLPNDIGRLQNDVGVRRPLADTMSVSEILADAERAFPESSAPALFGAGSSSAAYAGELEDVIWAPRMEARILEAIQAQRERGLVVRRSEVECRMVTCAVLLVHAADRGQGSVDGLVSELRARLGFSGVNLSGTEIPLAASGASNPDGSIPVFFVMGYAEILLTRADRTADSLQ